MDPFFSSFAAFKAGYQHIVCIPIPLGRSHTLLQTKATREIAIVYFSHKLLGEIYSDAWLRCEKSKSLFDATLVLDPDLSASVGKKLFPYHEQGGQ